jgi:hypothetical protein
LARQPYNHAPREANNVSPHTAEKTIRNNSLRLRWTNNDSTSATAEQTTSKPTLQIKALIAPCRHATQVIFGPAYFKRKSS